MNGTFQKNAAATLLLAATHSVVRPAISHELDSSFRISSEQSRHGEVEQPWSYFSFPAIALAPSHMSLSSLTERSSSETPSSSAAPSISSQR